MVSEELTAALLTSFYCRDDKCDMYIKEKKKNEASVCFPLCWASVVFFPLETFFTSHCKDLLLYIKYILAVAWLPVWRAPASFPLPGSFGLTFLFELHRRGEVGQWKKVWIS